MERKFKVCIVGCGVISANHIPSLLRLDNVEIIALCDIDTKKAELRKEQFSFSSKIYDDYITMLDENKPDSVHILTPHYLHAQMAIEALSRDINVLLEKPTCIKEEEIQKLLLLLLFLVGKLLFTLISYGCGVPGGFFLPMLVIGALCGSICSLLLSNVNLDILGRVDFLFLYLLSLKAHSRGKTRAEV